MKSNRIVWSIAILAIGALVIGAQGGAAAAGFVQKVFVTNGIDHPVAVDTGNTDRNLVQFGASMYQSDGNWYGTQDMYTVPSGYRLVVDSVTGASSSDNSYQFCSDYQVYIADTYSTNEIQLSPQVDETDPTVSFLSPTSTKLFADAGQVVSAWMSRYGQSRGGSYSWVSVTGHLVTMPPSSASAVAPERSVNGTLPPSLLKRLSHGRL